MMEYIRLGGLIPYLEKKMNEGQGKTINIIGGDD
jgi:hypothetical protein